MTCRHADKQQLIILTPGEQHVEGVGPDGDSARETMPMEKLWIQHLPPHGKER